MVPRLRIVACATLASASGDERLHPAYVGRGEDGGVPGQRAHPDAVVVDLDGVQARAAR